MDLIISTIKSHKKTWLQSEIENQSSVYGSLLNYIYKANKLRIPQVESIETYLYLRHILGSNSLLSGIKDDKLIFDNKKMISNLDNFYKCLLDEFENKKHIHRDQLKNFDTALSSDSEGFVNQIFDGLGDLNYSIYSLPMGAGKTYLMASLIYIELYLSRQQNDGAKNFLITIPSSKKTSILNSLKSIRKFDPSWVLPTNEAKKLYQIVTEKFIILDQSKSSKNSNTTENPNVAKIQRFLAEGENLEGLVVIVNAEKVILDRIDKIDSKTLFDETEKEKLERANELRGKLGQIPNLMVLMDEVHHNQDKENLLNTKFIHGTLKESGNLVRVLGFTGTPYFTQKININGCSLTITQIPSTVYHYSLADGISKFLKKPVIKEKVGLSSQEIVKSGLEEFFENYNFNYTDGRSTKLAIYCASIDDLKNQVLPIIKEFYTQNNRDFDEVFYFHTDTKDYKCPKEYAKEFDNLDIIESTKRVVLLVGIGSEGWDCQSLTGVIFSNQNKSSNIKVLQSVCRCLREVNDASLESGLIVLNTQNKQFLADELKKQHNIELKQFENGSGSSTLTRINRTRDLKLPKIKFNQLQTKFIQTDKSIIHPDTKVELEKILISLEQELRIDKEHKITNEGLETSVVQDVKTSNIGNPAHYDYWLLDIVKYSLGEIAIKQLENFEPQLKPIFDKVTINQNQSSFENLSYNQIAVKTSIIRAFVAIQMELETELSQENIEIDWLVEGFDTIPLIKYGTSEWCPTGWQKDFTEQLDPDLELKINELKKIINTTPSLKEILTSQIDLLKEKQSKSKIYNHSYHYAPYDFKDSQDEVNVYKALVVDQDLVDQNIECYYSGDRFLSAFKINTFQKVGNRWKSIRAYTPDFVAIKRNNQSEIQKMVIVETKGREDDTDKAISEFMRTEFVAANPNIQYHYSLSSKYKDLDHRVHDIKNEILKHIK